MATKNLARTVIEAGRTGSSKYARRRLRRLERREAKHFCYLAKNLIHEEDLGPKPVRLKRGWEFQQDDKIGPAMRWMMSKVGEVWDEVYSELSAKFRQRGIALSHVVDVHMLGWVDMGEAYRWSTYFFIDEDGLLQKQPQQKRNRWKPWRPKSDKWAGERRVIVHGATCYWTKPDYAHGLWGNLVPVSHRQDKEFSAEDYEFWNSLSEADQNRVIHHRT